MCNDYVGNPDVIVEKKECVNCSLCLGNCPHSKVGNGEEHD